MKFTKENRERLEVLFVQLSFAGSFLQGKMGANVINPWEILNQTSVTSLRTLLQTTKKAAAAYDELDEWTSTRTDSTEKTRLQTWSEFLNLVIGYKISLEEKSDADKLLAKKRRERDQLKSENMTPAERLAALDAEIAELEA